MRKVCKKHKVNVKYMFMRDSGTKVYLCNKCVALISEKETREIK